MSSILDPLFASAQQLAVVPRLLLAQTTDSDLSGYHYEAHASSPVANVIALAIGLLLIVAMWKIFTKAGHPGWASLIPIYNAYILLKIAGKPGWWLILFFIPLVNIVIFILVGIGLANAFGKGAGFGLGIAFLGFIFLPILAFDGSQYRGALPAPAL
jgi:hypothetical protein